MVKRITLAFVVASLLLIVSPVLAAERISSIPEPTPHNSGRLDLAFDINQLVPIVGKAEFSGDRVHAVLKDLINNETIEIVVIGDTTYTRMNEERRWKMERGSAGAAPIANPVPAVGPEDLTFWRVGDADVNGNPTTQYQAQVSQSALQRGGESPFTGMKLDSFIGKNDNFLHKSQVTLSGNDPDLGPLTFQIVTVFSAFNQPMVIGAPPEDLVDPARAGSSYRAYKVARGLPSWARAVLPYAMNQLRARR